MGAGGRSRRTGARPAGALVGCLVALTALTACGGVAPEPGSSGSAGSASSASSSAPSASPSASSTPTPTTPTASPVPGVTLRALGFVNGPRDAVSIPQGSVFRVAVDQPNVVTLVLTWPSPTDVAGHLKRTLPAEGFEITADDRSARTFTFRGPATGPQWIGTFTATDSTSAIVLQAA